MGSFIESLESRTLLSASAAAAALNAEGKVLLADTRLFGKDGTANLKLIEADLKAADETKSSRSLVRTITVQGASAFNTTSRAVIKTYATIFVDVLRLDAAATRLAKHPTNAIYEAKVTADENTLMTDASNHLAIIGAALNTQEMTNETNFEALETANPSNTQLASDAMNVIGPRVEADSSAISTAATIALTTDVNQVIADISA